MIRYFICLGRWPVNLRFPYILNIGTERLSYERISTDVELEWKTWKSKPNFVLFFIFRERGASTLGAFLKNDVWRNVTGDHAPKSFHRRWKNGNEIKPDIGPHGSDRDWRWVHSRRRSLCFVRRSRTGIFRASRYSGFWDCRVFVHFIRNVLCGIWSQSAQSGIWIYLQVYLPLLQCGPSKGTHCQLTPFFRSVQTSVHNLTR